MSVISVRNLGVRYTIYRSYGTSLRRGILQFFSGDLKRRDFWALRHVDLEIAEGQILGVIGPNGAGKSTLCLALAQVLVPDEGEVIVRGTVAPILALGVGFSQDMSGRENIRLGGALMGYSPETVAGMEPAIIEFAELGDFIDNPIRTYSSGMRARLAFAMATCIEPDVLILDEILGVGDATFREKSQKRMHELMDRARAIILVSHATGTIRDLCRTTLWLQEGQIRACGPTEYVVKEYDRWAEAEAAKKR